jgi:hypothetical protein
LADSCWKPSDDPSQAWDDIPPTPPTELVNESSIACVAVACFMVACFPAPVDPWLDDGINPIYVCGEAPPNIPPTGGGGGGSVTVPEAFSSGFSSGFS